MGTVKYTGPVASFHCPTNADIRSLKVHFSPKQLGEGTPSPDNVREIEGWDGVEVYSYPNININTYNVPNEYKKINYLESTGTQYIDTLISGGDSSTHPKYEIIFMPLMSSKTYQQYFAGERVPQGVPKLYKNGSTKTCVVQKAGIGIKDCNIAYNEISKIVVSEDLCEVNGINIEFDSSVALNGWGSSSWYIFNSHSESTLASNMRLYGLKMWSDEILIRNFIPCRRKSDDKPGIYDTVSGEFFTNQGSGEFICGPDIGETTNYTFGVLGKNKFDINLLAAEDIEVVDGVATGTGSAFNRAWRANDTKWIPFEAVPNQRVTLSFKAYTDSNVGEAEDSTGLVVYMHYTDGSKNVLYLKNNELTPTYHSITSNDGKSVSHIGIAYGSRGGNVWHLSEFQIEYNDTATTYEPYNPKHTVYGGWVDLISGEVCEEWWKILIPSSLSSIRGGTGGFVDNTSYQGETWTHRYFVLSKQLSRTKDVVSDKLVKGNCGNSAWKWGFDGAGLLHYSLGNESIGVTAETSASDRDIAVSNWLTNNPITLVYQLATPNTYSLAPTQLQTFLGANNVWSNADYVEVEYDLHETQDILARKQFIMASQPHVEEASGAIATFTTDMAAKLKECKVGFKPKQDLHGYSKPWVGGAGKNLFNINAIEQNPSDTTMANTTQRIFTPNTFSVGASYSNWWQASKITDYSITDNTITVTASTGYGVGFALKVKPETYYTVSATRTGDSPRINNAFYDSQGNYLGSSSTGPHITTFETPADTDIMVIIFAPQNNSTATYTDIQVEEGQTATSYEPYENICPIEGWGNIEVTRTGKNIGYMFVNPDGFLNWPDSTTYNGTSGISSRITTPLGLIGKQVVYSAYIDALQATDDNAFGRIAVWSQNKDLKYIKASVGVSDNVNKGVAKRISTRPITIGEQDYYFQPGASKTTNNNIQIGYFQLELGDTATEYEPYNGETIPVTFPVTKNLLDVTSNTTAYNTISTSNGVISCTSVTSGNATNIRFTQEFPAGTYTISLRGCGEGFGGVRLLCNTEITGSTWNQYYDAYWIDIYNGGQTDTLKQLTFTLDAASTLGLVFLTKYNYANQPAEIYDIQIEQGSTATAYEPYRTIYGGYVDLTTGEVWKTYEKINLPVFAQQGTWDSTAGKGAYWYTSGIQKLATTNDGVLCNRCAPISNTTFENTTSVITWYYNGIIRWIDIGTMEMTVAEYRNYLAENPLQVTYKLNTPVLVGTLSPSQLKSLRGINNIYSNTNDNITVKYWKH